MTNDQAPLAESARRFAAPIEYQPHFLTRMRADLKLIPVSRTIGSDRLVDRDGHHVHHFIEVSWMLPGILPTGNSAIRRVLGCSLRFQ